MPTLNKFATTCFNCGTPIAAQRGHLEPSSKGWRVKCAVPCQPVALDKRPQSARAAVGGLEGILALFERAKRHLKFPAIVLSVPGTLLTIRINVAGERARVPGSLTVVDAEKPADGGQRDWLGRVFIDGTFAPSGQGMIFMPALLDRLRQFAADPAKVAGEDGRLHGRCCFCRLPLSDERSTIVGYGPKCAQNYDLPWGAKAHAFEAGTEARVDLLNKLVRSVAS